MLTCPPKTIPLNKVAINILLRKSKIRSIDSKIVFSNHVGRKIDASKLRKTFRVALQQTSIENFKWHDLRHTFATRLAQNGVDIHTISRLLGHKNMIMSQRYAHHSPESLRVGTDTLDQSGHN